MKMPTFSGTSFNLFAGHSFVKSDGHELTHTFKPCAPFGCEVRFSELHSVRAEGEHFS